MQEALIDTSLTHEVEQRALALCRDALAWAAQQAGRACFAVALQAAVSGSSGSNRVRRE